MKNIPRCIFIILILISTNLVFASTGLTEIDGNHHSSSIKFHTKMIEDGIDEKKHMNSLLELSSRDDLLSKDYTEIAYGLMLSIRKRIKLIATFELIEFEQHFTITEPSAYITNDGNYSDIRKII